MDVAPWCYKWVGGLDGWGGVRYRAPSVLIIWTNTFDNLQKYVVQFEDALLAVSWRRTRGS